MANSQTTGRRPKRSKAPPTVERPASRTAGAGAPQSGRAEFPIVGVGASAGGLEAFSTLLKGLPVDAGMAVVLVMHLDPSHDSLLSELLERQSALPVTPVTDGMQVERDHVYVIPPNTSMTIDGVLRLVKRSTNNKRPTAVDDFLTSLARERKSGAIGVVLSGVGSDGTDGLTAIKVGGGITFAQDDTAQYPGMPHAAIAAGCVDFVLPPEKIADELVRMSRHPYLGGGRQNDDHGHPREAAGLRDILRSLQRATGVDFSLYKDSTLQRRIARRMAMRHAQTFMDYAAFLQERPDEVLALFQDILIHVTGFFREAPAFEALKLQVLETLAEDRPRDLPIRIWSVGCSSGEETYSIAIALLEQLEQKNRDGLRIQIFGTDVSEQQIDRARTGIYPVASLRGVSSIRRRRYFGRVESGYQVAKTIRDLCVFARHDLSKDPPFSNIDLIACRNVLIYFDQALQRRSMSVFHYALNESGHLWLGKSETISAYPNLFKLEDTRYKLYSKKPAAVQPAFDLGTAYESRSHGLVTGPLAPRAQLDVGREAERLLLNRYAPPGFVVDSDLRILRFLGDTKGLVHPSPGEASFHLLKMVRAELVAEVRAAIRAAKTADAPVRRRGIRFDDGNRSVSVDVEVTTMKSRNLKEVVYLVLCPAVQEIDAAASADGQQPADTDERTALTREVDTLRDQLRDIIEDQEATSEELRAANEETLSSNEELQSTNEELETAKEELQSSNEELTTLNEELQKRNLELSQLANDLSNLLVGVEIPIVILGADLRIRRFTPMAEQVLNLIPSDQGRPLDHIRSNLDVDWEPLVREVSASSSVVEREVQTRAGHWYSLRMRPYKTPDQKTDGVLIALLDIDTQKRMATAIVETSQQPLIVLDSRRRVVTANPAFYRTFQCERAQMEGSPFFKAAGQAWYVPALRELLDRVGVEAHFIEKHPLSIHLPDIGERELLVSARRMQPDGDGEGEATDMLLLAIEDVTAEREAQRRLRLSEEQFRLLADTSQDLIGLHDLEGRCEYLSPSYTNVLGYTPQELLGKPLLGLLHPDDRKQFRDAIENPVRAGKSWEHTCRLRNSAGEFCWFEFKMLPLLNDDGVVTQVKSAARDVSARVQAVDALSAKEAELRRLASALIEAQEAERRRIARELHDDMNQRLALLIQQAERAADSDSPDEQANALDRIRQLADSLAVTVRNMAQQLHPSAIDHLSLNEALRGFCREFTEGSRITVFFTQRNPIAPVRPEVALCAYRVLQEALRNVELHAGVARAQVTLTGRKRGFRLLVSDRGRGFDMGRVGRVHLGLVSMTERATLVGGTLNVRSSVGAGTRVELEVPQAPSNDLAL